MTSHPHTLAPTRAGDLHRTAAQLCETFPDIDLYCTVGATGLGVQVTGENPDVLGALGRIADALGIYLDVREIDGLASYSGTGTFHGTEIKMYAPHIDWPECQWCDRHGTQTFPNQHKDCTICGGTGQDKGALGPVTA